MKIVLFLVLAAIAAVNANNSSSSLPHSSGSIYDIEEVQVYDQENRLVGTGDKIIYMVAIEKHLVDRFKAGELKVVDKFGTQFEVIYIFPGLDVMGLNELEEDTFLVLNDPGSMARIHKLVYQMFKHANDQDFDFDGDGKVTSKDQMIGMMGRVMKQMMLTFTQSPLMYASDIEETHAY